MIATWKAQSCTLQLKRDARGSPGSSDTPIKDSLASPQGHAFVSLLTNDELKVGRGMPNWPHYESWIKGVPRNIYTGNMRGQYALDEAGTRLAVLEPDSAIRTSAVGGKRIRIYTVGGERIFFTEHAPSTLAVSPDGAWVAQASSFVSDRRAELRVTSVGEMLVGEEFPKPRWRIPLPWMPVALFATRNSILARFAREGPLHHYDAATGSSFEVPLPSGLLDVLGAEGELILVGDVRDGDSIVRTRDGSRVAPWEVPGAHPGKVSIFPSAAGTAILVTRPAAPGASAQVANAYVVLGGKLEPTGQLVDLPAGSYLLEISDDGRAVRELRSGRLPLHWDLAPGQVTSALDPSESARARARSTTGRFTVRNDDSKDVLVDQGSAPLFSFPRSDAGFPVVPDPEGRLRASTYWFSVDERLLAYSDSGRLKLLDLETMRSTTLTREEVRPRHVAFVAGNSLLHVKMRDGREMLMPISSDAVRRFALWVVPRSLTPEERCTYKFAGPSECKPDDASSSEPDTK